MTDKSISIDWKKLQILQLMGLLEVKRICEKHNINYFLVFGTLLGAIRHRGFIPWDDDVDIAMLRADFDKFVKVCPTELSSAFFLQTHESDPNYPSPLVKIRINDTLSVQRTCAHVSMHHGIWIDIFPYDNSPNSNVFMKLHALSLRYLELLLYLKSGYYKQTSDSKIRHILWFVLLLLRESLLRRLYLHTMKMYNSRKTGYVAPTTSVMWYEKDRYFREDVTDLIDVDFEGYSFKAPRNYDKILSKTYGYYLTLPPMEKRTTNISMFSHVSYGKYSDITSVEDAFRIANIAPPEKHL